MHNNLNFVLTLAGWKKRHQEHAVPKEMLRYIKILSYFKTLSYNQDKQKYSLMKTVMCFNITIILLMRKHSNDRQ